MLNPKVEEYFSKQTPEHQALLEKLRQVIFKTFPNVEEGFMWGVPVYAEGRFYLAALRKQVNFGFSIIGLSKEEAALFEGSGKTARHIKVYKYDKDIEKKLVKLMKLIHKKAGIPIK